MTPGAVPPASDPQSDRTQSMNPIRRFALEQHSGPYESWPSRSHLIDAGVPTKVRVPGYNLLHQFALAAGFLLITDFDCPFEEATTFVLLAPDLKVLGTKTLGAPYASFLLDKVDVIDATSVRVVFYDDDVWRVTVRKSMLGWLQPRLRVERWARTTGSA